MLLKSLVSFELRGATEGTLVHWLLLDDDVVLLGQMKEIRFLVMQDETTLRTLQITISTMLKQCLLVAETSSAAIALGDVCNGLYLHHSFDLSI